MTLSPSAGTIEAARQARPPRASVIVPHYQDLAGLDQALAALALQTFPASDFEIIVADNNSPIGLAAVEATVRRRARVVVVAERGAGPARNGGVGVARGDVLAFTDSDCLPEPGWLAAGIDTLAAFDFIGGRMKVLVVDHAQPTQAEAFETVFAFDNETYVRRKGFTVTANLFCTRSVFDAVGGFRTGVSEDLEWSSRARSRGFKIGYAPDAVVGHPARRTWAELQLKWRRLDGEMYQFFRRQPAGRLRRLIHALGLPLSAVAHSPRVLASQALNSPGQKLAGLTMLFRLRLWRFVNSVRLVMADRTD